jgi:membrane protease YdiL (CAAX protease family)
VIVAACVLSSAMFGLAHPFNSIGAAVLAPLLAIAYLWGGWESSVTAHFVANVILFSLYY